jgi:hypothetical protein
MPVRHPSCPNLSDWTFDEHAQGKSFNVIAVSLNEEGVPTAKGGRWHASTISHVFHSEDVDRELAKIRSGLLA